MGKIIKNIIKYKFPLMLLVLVFVLSWSLFIPGYFTHQDDIQVLRIYELRRCFADFQIPCRWAPDMAWGYGQPLFNFYSNFPYYIGSAVSFIVGYITAAKILFFLPTLVSALSIYYLGSELFNKKAGFVSSVLYLTAPYRALDLFVRGAVSESLAMSIVPLILYLIIKLIKTGYMKYFYLISLSVFILLTTHNIMSLIFMPVIILWGGLMLLVEGQKYLKKLMISLVVGIGLSSYYIIPAFFEKSMINTEGLLSGNLDFRVHFLAILQFIEKNWGYGSSFYGPDDTMSFQLGYPHLLIALISVVLLIYFLVKRKINISVYKNAKINKILLVGIFFAVMFVGSLFMMHNRSTFIWEGVSILRFIQFPWRFLSLNILSSAILGGWLLSYLKGRTANLLLMIITIISLFLNFSYFKPYQFFALTSKDYFKPEFFNNETKDAMLDYLPLKALPPRHAADNIIEVEKGSADVIKYESNSNRFSLDIKVDNYADITIPVYDFPKWELYLNSKKITHRKNIAGLIQISLNEGLFSVEGRFTNSPIRTISNLLTVFSFGFLLVYIVYEKRKTKYKK